MTVKRYLAGLLWRGSPARLGNPDWACERGGVRLFLESNGFATHADEADDLAVLVRGYVRPDNAHSIAESIADHYRQHRDLPVDHLDGNFTVLLLDGRAGRLVLYRNLIGSGFTYYREVPGGMLVGSNLGDLVDASGVTAHVNEAMLPLFFLYRFVPGRETLFQGFYRLMPGEQVTYDARGLVRRQRHTFAHLREERPVGTDAMDRVEDTLGHTVADCVAVAPRAANLLSGGVDSCYLQSLWNRATPGETPVSFAVSVDHPRTRPDDEYAISAARALGTWHTFIGANRPYAEYLISAIAATGEPPNHVQAAYFLSLAAEMDERGYPIGLCGEGADSLFGTSLADDLHRAQRLGQLLPVPFLRRSAANLAERCGRAGIARALRLARRDHDYAHVEHPVNRVAVFADRPLVAACFGPRVMADADARRRALLDQYEVPVEPMERTHACGLLGEAMDSAALWTGMFNSVGGDLLCPYLDSRVLRLALSLDGRQRFPYRRPKELLKRALVQHMPRELVYRSKLGFGQPIFEWLAPGGQLRPLVKRIGSYEFLKRGGDATALARPGWFLYSLLCFDIWHKLFIDRTLSRSHWMHPPLSAVPIFSAPR